MDGGEWGDHPYIEFGNSSGFTTPSFSRGSTTASSYQATTSDPFVAGSTYYWRVRAANGTATPTVSGERRFTIAGTTGSAPGAVTLGTPAAGGVASSLTPTFSWSAASGATSYKLEVSTSSSFASTVVNTTSSITSYTHTSSLSPSTSYIWRVTALNAQGSTPSAEQRFTTYVTSVPVSVSRSFGAASSATDYQLVSVPGGGSRAVAAGFTGTAGTNWNVYRETGATSATYLQAFDGSFTFTPGEGFWAISQGAWSLSSQTATPVVLAADGTYSISLHNGWNIIANPFERDVPWAAVQAANGITGRAYGYNGGYDAGTATLAPYRATTT